MLEPDKEYKKVFPEVPIVEFRNGKSLKDYLVRAASPKMGNTGDPEPCGNGTCQVRDHIITIETFITKACGEVLKIQSGLLNSNSRFSISWDAKFVMILPMFEKLKQSFIFGSITIKVNTDILEKGNRTYHRSVFISKIVIEILMIGK